MQRLLCQRGLVALIDDEDAHWACAHTWTAAPSGHTFYASRLVGTAREGRRVCLHQEVARRMWPDEPQSWQCIDLANGNGLDCRRANIRRATRSQDRANEGPKRTNTSGYKGVYWKKSHNRWVAMIGVQGKTIYLGAFASAPEAAQAYDEAAERYYGEFAWLNRDHDGPKWDQRAATSADDLAALARLAQGKD